MAFSSQSSYLGYFLIFLALSSLTHVAVAGRQVPAASDKKEIEYLGSEEGTVLIPGIGRYMIGSHEKPSISGLDHSGPAAAHSQYLPGNDDTFVPNTGFEVPNPAGGGGGLP